MKWKDLVPRLRPDSGGEKIVAPPAPPAPPGLVAVPEGCTLFHITHWKAGSQWIRGILEELFGQSAIVQPQFDMSQVWNRPILPGHVYPCVYTDKPKFDGIVFPCAARSFVLIRDLRDTLVSAYFSLRNSHVAVDNVDYYRSLLTRLNKEEGMRYLAETWLVQNGWIQRTWLASGVPCFRLEDCMADPGRMLARILGESFGIELSAEQWQAIAERHSFARKSGGRERGQEDAGSHYRKGVAGDWQEQMPPAVGRRFEHLYNDLLFQAGYETKPGWSERCRSKADEEVVAANGNPETAPRLECPLNL